MRVDVRALDIQTEIRDDLTLVQPTEFDLEKDEEEAWDDDLDAEGDPDLSWDVEEEGHETASNESSVTLSSKTSKRSFDEIDDEDAPDEAPPSLSSSPGRSSSVRILSHFN